VLAHALAPANQPITLASPASRIQEAAALALALCSLLLGLLPWEPYLPIRDAILPNSFDPKAISKSLLIILGSAVAAILLGRWGLPPARSSSWNTLLAVAAPIRRSGLTLGAFFEKVDDGLRQWPAAGISLLTLALLFGVAMVVAS
jgi:hypothetical protein